MCYLIWNSLCWENGPWGALEERLPILEVSLIKQCLVASLEKGVPFSENLSLSKNVLQLQWFAMPKFSESIFSKGPGIIFLAVRAMWLCHSYSTSLWWRESSLTYCGTNDISSNKTSFSTSDDDLTHHSMLAQLLLYSLKFSRRYLPCQLVLLPAIDENR